MTTPQQSQVGAPSVEEIEQAVERLTRAAYDKGQSDEVDSVRWGESGDSHNTWMRRAMDSAKDAVYALFARHAQVAAPQEAGAYPASRVIEHAEYMATSAFALLQALETEDEAHLHLNDLCEDDIDFKDADAEHCDAIDVRNDAGRTLRNRIYEFRKRAEKWVAPLPSAPTQAAAPGVQGEDEPLGRFNHHPDAGIDFCVEVEAIRSEITDLAAGLPPTMDLQERIRRAMEFRVGGDADACRAKQQLREIEASLAASPAPGWQPPAPSVEQIASIVRDHLTAVYCCTRVWEAWSVGTMGEDDFVPASETEMPEEVAQAIVAAFASGGDPIRELLAVHQKLIDDGNDYAYFELARTRQTDWMAWITDKPARGEPGTAEYARSRRVIVRGQGDTPEEACRDALAALSAPPLPESQPEGDEPEATICPSCDGTGIEGIDRGEGLMPRCWSCKGSGSLPASPSLPSQEGQHG